MVKEVLKVFEEFAVVNLEYNACASYHRSGNGMPSGQAKEGEYTDFVRFLYNGIYPLGDNSATLEEYLSPAGIRRQMEPGRELLRWEYEDGEKCHKSLFALCTKRVDDVPTGLLLGLCSGEGAEASRFLETTKASLIELADLASDTRNREPGWECLKQDAYQGLRVLVAEDNTLSSEQIQEYLRIAGAEVDAVADGKEAVGRVAYVPDGYYDMILLDVQMPGMSGYDAARAIRRLDREQVSRIPIVAMTFGSSTEDTAAREAGMNACLVKPVQPRQLVELPRRFTA